MRWVLPPHSHSNTIHSCHKAAFMPPLCPLNSTAVSAHCAPHNTTSAGPRFFPSTSEAELEPSLQGPSVIHPGAPHRAHNPRNSPPARANLKARKIPHRPLQPVQPCNSGMPFTDMEPSPKGKGDPPLPSRGTPRCWNQPAETGATLFPPPGSGRAVKGGASPPRARGRRSRSVYLLCTLR